MSATVIGSIATAVADVITEAAVTRHGQPLKVYSYAPRDLDTLPAFTVYGPTAMRRRGAEEPESELGSYDWLISFELRLYVALDDPETAWGDVRAMVGQIIAALDADSQLGGLALDSVVESGELDIEETENDRQLISFRCDFVAWVLTN